MYLLLRGVHGDERRVHGWLKRERLVFYSCAMCVLYAIFLAAWAWTSKGFTAPGASRPGTDFSVFWSASHVMLHGSPWEVYDSVAFGSTERSLFGELPGGSFLPWLYPPTFLITVTPLALLPFLAAYFLFVGISGWSFVTGTLRVSGFSDSIGGRNVAALLLATCPCVFVAAAFGQNSLLTAALAVYAVYWIERNPARAGFCIGLLAIKPQMALIFPFVLIAAGAWRVLAVAAITAAVFAVLSVLVCGPQTIHLFLANVSMARDVLLEHGDRFWLASPTAFAALRSSGVQLLPAYAVQGCVAATAIAAACQVWMRTRDAGLRAAILVVATLLSNPYVWHYELAWLGIAMASLTAMGLRRGWLRGEQEILAATWLLPVYELFNRYLKLPQLGPIVLLMVLLLILRRSRVEVGELS